MNEKEEAMHTPGPWFWQMDQIDRGSRKGQAIRRALWTGKPGSGNIAHATWNEFDGDVWQAWIAVKDADAALIAAAPALYEALKAIVDAEEAAFAEWHQSGAPEWKPGHPAYDRFVAARAALSAAKKQD